MIVQEYLSIFSSVEIREVLPFILAGILGLTIAIIFYLLIRIQGAINKSTIDNNKLLEMITAVNESSQKLDRETTQATIGLNSSYESLTSKIEGLIQTSENFRSELDRLQAIHEASVEKVISNVLESDIQKQSDKLQALGEKLETFTQLVSQVKGVEEKTSNLENILAKLQEVSHSSQEMIGNLASKNIHNIPEDTLQSLQTLSDKLTELESYKTQTEALVKTTADEVETRMKKLLEVKKTKAKSTKKGMSPTK